MDSIQHAFVAIWTQPFWDKKGITKKLFLDIINFTRRAQVEAIWAVTILKTNVSLSLTIFGGRGSFLKKETTRTWFCDIVITQ